MSGASSKTDDDPSDGKPGHVSPLAALALVLVGFAVLPIVADIVLAITPQLLLGWDRLQLDQWSQSPAGVFLYVLLAEGLTIGLLWWFVHRRKLDFAKTVALKRRPHWRDLGYALIGFVGYFILFIAVAILVDQFVHVDTEQKQALGFEPGVSGLGLWLAFASLVVVPPIAEEIIFRGFFYGSLRPRTSFVWATVITSMVFAALHLFGGADTRLLWIAALDTFVLSLVLCYAREKTDAIWAPMGIHALKNGFVFLNLFVIGLT